MARVNLVVQDVPLARYIAGAGPVFTAADEVNGMMFDNVDGRVLLLVKNAAVAAKKVKITSVPESRFGRTGDIGGPAVATDGISVNAATTAIFGFFPQDAFNQKSGADAGKVYVDVDDDTTVTMAAIRLQP